MPTFGPREQEIPKCPHCGAKYYACTTDFRGRCVKDPNSSGKPYPTTK